MLILGGNKYWGRSQKKKYHEILRDFLDSEIRREIRAEISQIQRRDCLPRFVMRQKCPRGNKMAKSLLLVRSREISRHTLTQEKFM